MTWKIYLAEKTSTCGSQLENLGFESKQLAFNQQNLVDSTGNNMDRTMIELLHDIKWYIEPRKTAMHTIERFQPDVVFLKNGEFDQQMNLPYQDEDGWFKQKLGNATNKHANLHLQHC